MSAEHYRRLPPLGLSLSLIGIVATLWLGATGQLGLYVHPRYFGFTLTLAALALVAIVASALLGARGHDHGPGPSRWRTIGRGVLLALVGVALLVVPPATLTSSTVAQRSLNASFDDAAAPALLGSDPAAFRLSDWAALIADESAMSRFLGRRVTLTGFVTPDPDGRSDLFHLARFSITCCTVDARPNGVAVNMPGWAEHHAVDAWLEVTGAFVAVPAPDGGRQVVLRPETVKQIDRPAQPYDF